MAKADLATFYKILKYFVFHDRINIYPQDQINRELLLTLETKKVRSCFKMNQLHSVLETAGFSKLTILFHKTHLFKY